MAIILVAENSRTQAVAIQLMLEDAGHTVRLAADGNEALATITDDAPDIVLTDMRIPGRNGLELTEAVRESKPGLPVVLITAEGSEDLAVKALRQGAATYIPKRQLEFDLIPTIGEIAAMLEARRPRNHVLQAMTHCEATYVFGNDRQFATALLGHVESELQELHPDDDTGLFQIVMSLKEAIANAIEYGNLELDSALRDEGDGSRFAALGEERRHQLPFCSRTVSVTTRISPEQLTCIIRDQGAGFDPSTLPDPEDPKNFLKTHGRGLLLARRFMDQVSFNEAGNEVTMIRSLGSKTASPDSVDEPAVSAVRGLRILLAEDSQTNRVLATGLLEDAGYRVEVAQNGVEAVDMSADAEFDLILMDVEMPELDGIAATSEIRRREAECDRRTTIIAMTGHGGDQQHERCLNAGMDGFLTKPIRTEELRNILEGL